MAPCLIAAAVTALAGEVRSASKRDSEAVGTMAQQIAKTTDVLRSIAILLASNGEETRSAALENWEARRSS